MPVVGVWFLMVTCVALCARGAATSVHNYNNHLKLMIIFSGMDVRNLPYGAWLLTGCLLAEQL